MWKRSARVAFTVGCMTCAGQAFAQTPSPAEAAEPPRQPDPVARARERYDGGTRAAFGQGRFVEAALEFEAAAAEKPSAVALSTAAMSWERASVLDRAADDYARTVAMSGLPAEQAAAAGDRLAALERRAGDAGGHVAGGLARAARTGTRRFPAPARPPRSGRRPHASGPRRRTDPTRRALRSSSGRA